MGPDERTNSADEVKTSFRNSTTERGTSYTSRPFGTRSRLRRARSEASNDIESWATEGMKGHVLLVRNSTMLVANVIAQRNLEARLYDLSRERYERLRSNERDRELFLRRLQTKGGRMGDIVAEIEAKKKFRARTAGPRAISELRSLSASGRTTQSLMVHPLPFWSRDGEDTERQDAHEQEEENEDAVATDDADISTDFRKYGSQSAHRYSSRHRPHDGSMLRSFSGFPAARGRYETYFPTKRPSTTAGGTFVPASTLVQYPSEFADDEIEVSVRPKSCVFSEVSDSSLMSEIPECAQVTRLIENIDSLHVPPKNPKKVKPKSEAILKDIFRL